MQKRAKVNGERFLCFICCVYICVLHDGTHSTIVGLDNNKCLNLKCQLEHQRSSLFSDIWHTGQQTDCDLLKYNHWVQPHFSEGRNNITIAYTRYFLTLQRFDERQILQMHMKYKLNKSGTESLTRATRWRTHSSTHILHIINCGGMLWSTPGGFGLLQGALGVVDHLVWLWLHHCWY